jgi:hypothetical protein
MSALIFSIGIVTVLTLEGRLLAGCVSREWGRGAIGWSLGYPLGAFLNALIFFLLHLLNVPFRLVPIAVAHGLLLGVLCMLHRKTGNHGSTPLAVTPGLSHKAVALPLILLLLVVCVVTVFSVTTLPSIYWDSFTNWAMRSKQSLHAGSFLMDGIVQPQYPILLHALQMVWNIGAEWSDRLANVGTFFLTASSFTGFFLLMQKRHNTISALVTVTLLTGIPIVQIHLRQGMADIHVGAYILLSALFLDIALRETDQQALILSALFVAAAAWTKFEGLYFGVVPWLVVVIAFSPASFRSFLSFPSFYSFLPPLLIFPWLLFISIHGLSLSPHGFSIEPHPEAIPHFFEQLFLIGTFGLHFWAIALSLTLLVWAERREIVKTLTKHPSLLWALLTFALLIYTFLFTKEYEGLIHRHNFSRAAMVTVFLFTQALCSAWGERWMRYNTHTVR